MTSTTPINKDEKSNMMIDMSAEASVTKLQDLASLNKAAQEFSLPPPVFYCNIKIQIFFQEDNKVDLSLLVT